MDSMERIKNIECFLFDLDGTIYLEGKLLEGAKPALDALEESGKKVIFLTNNSSVATATYVDKLTKMGLHCTAENMLTSGGATIAYLKKHFPDRSIYLVGTRSLLAEFEASGLRMWKDVPGEIATGKDIPDVCVLAYDREINYEKLVKLTRYISLGSEYIATHPDINCPAEVVYQPDIGAIMALVQSSTGKSPSVICGKPFSPIAEVIKEKTNLPPNKIAMVGDRLSTDIAFAIANNFLSCLVLSGETSATMASTSHIQPDVILDGVFQLNPNAKT